MLNGYQNQTLLLRLVTVLACIFSLFIVYRVGSGREQLWDFKNYYAPVKVMEAGLDPYDHSNFKVVFPDGNHKRWQYPPITLWIFKPIAQLHYENARRIWFGLNLIFLSLLVIVWHRTFLHLSLNAFTIWFFLLAFNGTLIWGLASGNIVIIEQLLIFLGIAFLLNQKYWHFGICIAFSAQFKLVPVAFLVLLLISAERPKWKPFLGGSLIFFGLASLNIVFYADLIPAFLEKATTDHLVAPSNVSMRGFLAEMEPHVYQLFGKAPEGEGWLSFAVYMAVSIFVLVTSFYALKKYRHRTQDPRLIALFFCVVYCIVVPRLLAYSLITVLIPTLFLIRESNHQVVIPVILAIIFPVSYYPVAQDFLEKLTNFIPLIALFVVWVEWCRMLSTGAPSHESEAAG